ncbi:tRNA pseudouridine synthase B [bacterium HR37]|nr:tRNA pseudouridine synthase B [bacterium HR37]
MDGIVIVDKPKGISSRETVDKVKRILKTKRAGHTGTLDPFATGVLPVCLGKATRIIPFLDEELKEYEAVLKLGITTDTMDLTGRVLCEKEVGHIGEGRIKEVFSELTGVITQTPPMFSALKKDGVRLYKLAREGKRVEIPARKVVIYELKLLELNLPYIRFFVRCSRGTYVRVLGSDIGMKLGCGGHLVELRRIRSGQFSIEDSASIEDIERGVFKLIDMNQALSHLKEVKLKSKDVATLIRQGRQIQKSYLNLSLLPEFNVGDKLRVCCNSDLVAVVESLVDSSNLDKLHDRYKVLKLLRVFDNQG